MYCQNIDSSAERCFGWNREKVEGMIEPLAPVVKTILFVFFRYYRIFQTGDKEVDITFITCRYLWWI